MIPVSETQDCALCLGTGQLEHDGRTRRCDGCDGTGHVEVPVLPAIITGLHSVAVHCNNCDEYTEVSLMCPRCGAPALELHFGASS